MQYFVAPAVVELAAAGAAIVAAVVEWVLWSLVRTKCLLVCLLQSVLA